MNFIKVLLNVVKLTSRQIMPWLGIEDGQQTSLKFNKNDRVEVVNANLSEKRTSPPDYLSESELITLMEKHGIGKFVNDIN